MGNETSLTVISESIKLLSSITDISDSRRMVSVARGLVTAAVKEYKAAATIGEIKEDRDQAYETAVKAGEFRLMAEARLGELIQQEQQAGRLATEDRSKMSNISVTHLKDYGLTKQDSSRAQQIADHQELIQKAVESARRYKDIPTRKSLELLIRNSPKPPAPPSPCLLYTSPSPRD